MAGDSATIPLRGDTDDLEAKLDAAIGMLQGWGGNIKKVFAGLGIAAVAKKAFDFGAGMIESAQEAEKNAVLLDQTIKNLGGRATMSADQVKAFASEIMNLTTFEDDAAIKAQTLFLRLDSLDANGIKRATVAAADLATVMGTDLEAAASKITNAMKDPERAIGGLRQAGIKFTAEEENMIKALAKAGKEAEAQEIILSKLEKSIGGSAAAAGQTAGGQWEIFKNKLSDAGEAIGTALMPMLASLTPALEGFSNWVTAVAVPAITEMIGMLAEWGKAFVDFLQPAFDFMVDAGVHAFTAVQTGIQNFADVAKLALVSFLLGVIKTFETVKHFLVVAVPEYLAWFGRNWKGVFVDMFNLTTTIFSNMWKNVVSFWDGLKSLFSGNGFTFEITPLTEGFKSVTEELPKIAERVKGELEQGLEVTANNLNAKIGGAFDANLKKNRAALGLDKPDGGVQKPKQPSIIEKPAGDTKLLAEATAAGAAAVKAEEEKKDKKKDDGSVKATIEDLASLQNRIQGAAASTPEKAIKDGAEKQVAATDRVAQKQEEAVQIAKQQLDATRDLKAELANAGKLK